MANEVNKLLLVVAAFALGLGIGGYAGTDAAQKAAAREMAEQKASAAEQKANLEKKYRELEKADAKKVSEAIAARDQALADAADLRADADSVRRDAEAYRKRLSGSSCKTGDSCQSYRKQLERCAGLLSESAGLLERGTELSQKLSADKDALSAIVK